MKDQPLISIIIPTLNEELNIPLLLESLLSMAGVEIIVADGSSVDATLEKCRAFPVRLVNSLMGRGVQLNAGARCAEGEILLFLHADSSIERRVLDDIREAVSQGSLWGCCNLRFNEENLLFCLIAYLSNLRARIFCSCYGDQGIFCQRDLFWENGGFPETVFLEDLGFSHRIRKGQRARIVKGMITTSTRRFRKAGIWKTIAKNQMIKILYAIGIKPDKLGEMVSVRLTGDVMRTAVVVMSKIPQPGFTKTRLMSTLVGQECAEFHRACLADTCRAIKKSGLPGYIYYVDQNKSPQSTRKNLAEDENWGLPEEDQNYFKIRPQRGEDLGERLYNSAREILNCYEAVLFLGSDMPDITAEIILEAHLKMPGNDVVLGPAVDGGYYLLGIKQALPYIFHNIPWETSQVLEKTLKRINERDLTYHLLNEKSDIDTWDNLVNFYYAAQADMSDFNRCLKAYKVTARLAEKYR